VLVPRAWAVGPPHHFCRRMLPILFRRAAQVVRTVPLFMHSPVRRGLDSPYAGPRRPPCPATRRIRPQPRRLAISPRARSLSSTALTRPPPPRHHHCPNLRLQQISGGPPTPGPRCSPPTRWRPPARPTKPLTYRARHPVTSKRQYVETSPWSITFPSREKAITSACPIWSCRSLPGAFDSTSHSSPR
jgi:hypothetical protein